MDWVLIMALGIALLIFAGVIFLIGLALWLALRTIFAGFSLGAEPKPCRHSLARVRAFMRAKAAGSEAPMAMAAYITESNAEAHGDVPWVTHQAAYPEALDRRGASI